MYTDDVVAIEFIHGVNDYWGGELPENWNNEKARAESPYLAGWYMASLWEVEPGRLLDADGAPLQDED